MTITWLFHLLLHYNLILVWTFHDYHMTIARLFYDSSIYYYVIIWFWMIMVTITWLSHDCHMTVTWLSHDCHMTATWLPHDCSIYYYVIISSWYDHNISCHCTCYHCTYKHTRCATATTYHETASCCCSVCSVLQCVAVCCSVLQCIITYTVRRSYYLSWDCIMLLQCVAVCCSVLQCVAVCCSA